MSTDSIVLSETRTSRTISPMGRTSGGGQPFVVPKWPAATDGYASEAVEAVVDLAFNEFDLHRVIARVDARNAAAMKLAERIGMRSEPHLIQNHWYKGDWSDEWDTPS